MTRHIVCFLFLCLAVPFCSIAQNNFIDGYIVTIDGDTIYGFINDRGTIRNSKLIEFKDHMNSTPNKYLPKDITAFKIADKKYHSATLNYNDAAFDVFSELINDGKLKLFSWRDTQDKTHYYVKKDGKVYNLENDKTKVTRDSNLDNHSSKAYIDVLSSLTADCPVKISSKLPFTLNSISKVVNKYNECNGSNTFNPATAGDGTIVIKSVYVGVNKSDVLTTGPNAKFSNATPRFGPSIGVGLNVNFFEFNENLFVDLAAEYNQKGAIAEKEKIDFNLHYLNTSFGLSYLYPKGKIRPFVGSGFIVGFLLNSETAYTIEENGKRSKLFGYSPTMPVNGNTVKYEVGFELKAGVKFQVLADKTALIKVRYSRSVMPFDFASQGYYNEVMSLQLGYEF